MLATITAQFGESGSAGQPAGFVVFLFLFTALELLPVCAICYLFYFLLTLPMRRNERSRLFLDLLELGLKDGRTPEHAIMDAAASRDQAPGVRFHLLAAFMEKGMNLSSALEQVPRLLPEQVVAALKTGEHIGDITKVLPACRKLLNDGVSQVRGALNYVLILTFLITPVILLVPIMINVLIVPKFKEIFAAMMPDPHLPLFTQFIFSSNRVMFFIQAGIILLTWLAVLAYVGGPRVLGWLRHLLPGVPDWCLYHLAWRRKRLQRDFSAMLAVLLDSGVPEPEAVTLAAKSTTNATVCNRAGQVCRLLNSGVRLPVAIRAMDDSQELQWRLTNALQQGGGFLRALNGWHEALDARAFQLEQSAAQIATSLLVLFNGLIVASIAVAIFLALTNMIMEATLW